MSNKVIITNRGEVANRVIVTELGIISASIAPSKFIVKDIMASIRQIFGKEMKEYTDMINQAREKVIERMTKDAVDIGADAIVNIRFMGTGMSGMSAEMMGYGTAVKLKE